MIVGHGGAGFGLVERGARRRVALLMSSPHQRQRTVAVDDVARQLVALIDEPRAFGRHFDVGSDDVLTIDKMIDLIADHLHRRPPAKIHLPRRLIAPLTPFIERATKMPPGAIGGFFGASTDDDTVGFAASIRPLFAQPPLSFVAAMAQALGEEPVATAARA